MVRVTALIIDRDEHAIRVPFNCVVIHIQATLFFHHKRSSKMTRSGLIKDLVHDLPTPEPESPGMRRNRKPYRFSTLCATVENPSMKDQYGSSSVPIYQTATFKGVDGEYDYTRSGNPTRSHLGLSFLHSCM